MLLFIKCEPKTFSTGFEENQICHSPIGRVAALNPNILGRGGIRACRMVAQYIGAPLVGIRAPLGESHAVVEARRPERLERQIVGSQRTLPILRLLLLQLLLLEQQLALLELLLVALGGGRCRGTAAGREDPLGALQHAAHARSAGGGGATGVAASAATLRAAGDADAKAAPGARALQATYRAAADWNSA